MVVDVLTLSRKELIRWIKISLSRYGIKLKKKLSQVMMVEPRAFKRLFEAVTALVKDIEKPIIIEIGTGLGTLTSALGKIANSYIISIELDSRFAPLLKELQEMYQNIDIVISDARKMLSSVRSSHLVVGNLPYHITSDLVLEIGKSNILYAIITVQKDVAERFIANPGSKNYGKISLFVQYLFNVEILDILPPSYFVPSPEVFSAIILMKRKRAYSEYLGIEDIVKCMFSFRRKHVLKSFKKCLNLELSSLKIDESDEVWRKRVDQLAPEDIEKLVTILKNVELR